MPPFATIPRGGIVGSVHIVDCVKDSRSNWFVGEFGFVLERPVLMPRIALKGKLGIFPVPRDLLAA